MLKKLSRFYYPETIEDACKMLGNKGEKSAVIAGGTSEVLRQNNTIEALVDISRIKELNYIEKDGNVYKIGASTPVQDIYKSTDLKGASGELVTLAASKIGSTLLRNCITAGGNLAAVFPWSDLTPAYMALDAEIVCRRGKPKRTVPVTTLIEERPEKFLAEDEIIAEIQIPVYGENTGTSFHKLSKTSNDYSLITVAALITLKSGKIEKARIALNAVVSQPCRCPEAEELLVGQKPDTDLFTKAAQAVANAVKIRKDFRASVEYREEVLQVIVRRCLEEAAAKAAK